MTSTLRGFDELRNSAGTLVGPLGFGFSTDWETIDRVEVTSAVAQVDLVIPDNTLYDEYELRITNAHPATDARFMRMRCSTDGGATFDTGANYDWGGGRWNTGSGYVAQGGGSVTFIDLSGYGSAGNAAGENYNCIVRWNDLGSTVDEKTCYYHMHEINTNTAGQGADGFGCYLSTTAVDALRLFFDSGNIERGTFRLLGRRKESSALKSQDDWVVIDDQSSLSAVADHDVFWDDQVYDEIEVTVSGLTTPTDNTDLELFLSTDGSTFLSGASDYEWAHNSALSSASNSPAGSTGDTRIELVPGVGSGADEDCDVRIHIKNVSNAARKKKLSWNAEGKIATVGTFASINGGAILMDNNNSIRGIRLSLAGAVNLSADRVRVRGRRLTPTGVLKQDWEVLQIWDHAVEGDMAEIEFTNIPSNEFEELQLTAHDLNTGTSANNVILQFSQDNGQTWDTSANYDYAMLRMSGETANVLDNGTNQTSIQLTVNFGSNNQRVAHAIWNFHGLSSDSTSWPWISGIMSATNDAGNTRYYTGNGRLDSAGADGGITAFRLDLAAGGNFTGGRLVLRGRRKAEV